LIITKNGTVYEPKKDGDDSIQLGIPSRPPKFDSISDIECVETNLTINL